MVATLITLSQANKDDVTQAEYQLSLDDLEERTRNIDHEFHKKIGERIRRESEAALKRAPESSDSGDKKLSRHRRFFIPSSTGWFLDLTFTLLVPIQDIGSTLFATVPFAYSFDTGTYAI